MVMLTKDNATIEPELVTVDIDIPVILPIQGVRFSVNGVRLVHRVTPMMVWHQSPSRSEAIEDPDTTLVVNGEDF
jgi:hypothetical protein